MEQEFVSYELAVELKKIDFDEPCFKMSIHKKDCIEQLKPEGCQLHNIHCGYPDCTIDKSITPVPLPTYSQAFRWFRKKHGLYQYIEPKRSFPDKFVSGVEWNVIITGGDGIDVGPNGTYTYPEAERACLEKLIKLVK